MGNVAAKVPIGCNLTEQEAGALRAYAGTLELRVPSLCALLVLHELEHPELDELKQRHFRKVSKADGIRVTARIGNRAIKDAFSEHVRKCGLGSDDAAGVLFRAEPVRKWLAKALSWNGNHP